MGKLSNMTGGWLVTKWGDKWLIQIRMPPQSWGQAVLCHGVNPQVQKVHHAVDHVNIHVTTWGGVAGSFLILVGAGQLLPQAANKDPLGQAYVLWLWLQLQWGSAGVGSASLGELTSTQLEGSGVTRTSSSIKVTSGSIACWISNTLSTKWWGSLEIGSWAFSTQYWRAFV